MVSYINIMESINESLPTMKCSSCKVSREFIHFGPNGRNGCFKTCLNCRVNKKKSRDKKANSKTNEGSNPESEPAVSASSASSTCRDHWLYDGWADMTAELLEPMSYDERCAIHICQTTAVTRLYIFFICEKIIKYCGRDPSLPFEETGSVEVGTIMDTETIEVHLPDRGAHFTVKLGDTWGEIRENIHCS